jgi:glycine/D-amino acid oxidase-like deaminating enzyme
VRYALALARIAAARGARLIQRVQVTGLDEGAGVVVARTATGALITARQVLLATNAYPPLRRRLRHLVIPVYDHVIATAPLTDREWAAIGWHERVGVTDAGNQFHYYRPTPDGRILFGGWDATYHLGGRVDARLEDRPATHRLLAEHLVQTFPALDGIEITHAWGGPIDSTTRFAPTFGTAMSGRLAWALGYTGLGVGASRFGALVALDLLEGRETERTRLSMVRRSPMPFPPEPIRWPVVWWTKRALAAEDRTGRRGWWLRLLDRLGVGFTT